jgi:uncharacterized protein (TIGR02118 family)
MVKLIVAYGQPQDPAAFDQYYTSTHAPLVREMPGLQRFEAGRVLAMPDGSAPPYYFIAELAFDNTEALQAARASAEGAAVADDVANYATGGVTLMIVEA